MWPRVLVVLYLRQVTSRAGDMKVPEHLFNIPAHLLETLGKLAISEDLAFGDQRIVTGEWGSEALSLSALSLCRCPSWRLAKQYAWKCYHALPRNCMNVEDFFFRIYMGIRARFRHANLGITGFLDFGSHAPVSCLLMWLMDDVLARIAFMREQE